MDNVETVDLEELRRSASDYVRRAEAGSSFLITRAGRPSAVLGPAGDQRQWRAARDVAALLDSPGDDTREADPNAIADDIADPWPSPPTRG